MKGIKINDVGDIMITNRTILLDECSNDVAERVLQAYPGEIKEVPTLGIFTQQQLNGSRNPFLRGDIRKQLTIAGLNVKKIEQIGENINIEI